MRTQAKPFIVQIKKRKRTGADDSRPIRSLFGPVAKELADELDGTTSRFARGGDGGGAFIRAEDKAGALPAAASPAWPSPANAATAPANNAARVLPDLSRHDRAEPEEEVVAREPRIRAKRRYTKKPTRTRSPAPAVTNEKPVPPPAPAKAAPAADESSGETQKHVRRPRFKWSGRRTRRGKGDAGSAAQPPRGQRWKRRLPRAAR
jgi:hypothetical protein